MKEIYFKATKKQSLSYWKWKYRKIIKEWDLSLDEMNGSDDVIRINAVNLLTGEKNFNTICIDLDNKEWLFRIFFD